MILYWTKWKVSEFLTVLVSFQKNVRASASSNQLSNNDIKNENVAWLTGILWPISAMQATSSEKRAYYNLWYSARELG